MMLFDDARTIRKCEDIMKRRNEEFSYRDAKLATEVSAMASKLVAWTLVQKELSASTSRTTRASD
jgi:hypothetical protein